MADSPFAGSLARFAGGTVSDYGAQGAAPGPPADSGRSGSPAPRQAAWQGLGQNPGRAASAALDDAVTAAAAGEDGPSGTADVRDVDETAPEDTASADSGFPWAGFLAALAATIPGGAAAIADPLGVAVAGQDVTGSPAGPFPPLPSDDVTAANDGKSAQPTVVDAPAAGDVVTDFIARVREVASAGRSADARRIDIAAMFTAIKAPGTADVAQVDAAAQPVAADISAADTYGGDGEGLGYARFRAALEGLIDGAAVAADETLMLDDAVSGPSSGRPGSVAAGAGSGAAADLSAARLLEAFAAESGALGAADFAGRSKMTPREMVALILGADGAALAATIPGGAAAIADTVGVVVAGQDVTGSPAGPLPPLPSDDVAAMNDGKPAQPTVVDAPAAGDVVTDFIARVREVASAGRSADARRIDIAAMFAAMKAPGSADVAQAGGVAAGTAPAANPAASVDIAARSLGAEAFFRALAGNRAAAASGADDGNPGLAAGAGRTSAGGETLPVSTSGPLPAAVDDGDPAAETGDRAAARLLTALDAEKTTLDAERTTLRFGDGDGLGPPPQAAAPPTPGPAAGLPGGATAAAAADPAALVADTVSSDDILRQVTVRLSRLQPGDGQVRLQLQPAELGRVDVQLTMESHEMTARFIVQHPEVRELLHRHLDQLRDSLAVNGVEVKQVAVEVAPAHRGEGANLNAAHQDGRDAFGSPGHSGGRQDDGGTRGDHPRTVVADAENIAGRATAGGAADDHPEGHTATRRRSLDLRV